MTFAKHLSHDINKGVILAAGLGTRLQPMTEKTPKCLLTVGKSTILERAIKEFNAVGVNEITVVTGFKKESIEKLGLNTVYNPAFAEDNILGSFYSANELGLTQLTEG